MLVKFKVKKMQFKQFQNMSEVAVGRGGGSQKLKTKSEVLGFF